MIEISGEHVIATVDRLAAVAATAAVVSFAHIETLALSHGQLRVSCP
jgi:hypothetical protein